MSSEEFDLEEIRRYRALSPREKLEYLEKMLRFLHKITPAKSKELNERLKAKGF